MKVNVNWSCDTTTQNIKHIYTKQKTEKYFPYFSVVNIFITMSPIFNIKDIIIVKEKQKKIQISEPPSVQNHAKPFSKTLF